MSLNWVNVLDTLIKAHDHSLSPPFHWTDFLSSPLILRVLTCSQYWFMSLAMHLAWLTPHHATQWWGLTTRVLLATPSTTNWDPMIWRTSPSSMVRLLHCKDWLGFCCLKNQQIHYDNLLCDLFSTHILASLMMINSCLVGMWEPNHSICLHLALAMHS